MAAHFVMQPFSPEQLCLLDRAKRTWFLRGEGKRLRSPVNEECMTELLLLNLKRYYPGRVTIQPFHKQEEGKTGGDWSWTFVSHDGKWSQSMLVQAKRLDDFDCYYNKLDYRIGKKPTDGSPHVLQIDQLIETAERRRQLPVYIFYNHLSDPSRVIQNCGTLNSLGKLWPQSWGITFASALAVRNALSDKRFDRHRRHSRPFHCLLCSQGIGDRAGSRPKGSPEVVAAALSQLFADDGLEERIHLGMSSLLEPSEGIPPICLMAEEVASVSDAEERDERAEVLGREFQGIAGAVILRDSLDLIDI